MKSCIENNTVVNLSKNKLSLSQLYVLNKGLNFCLSESNKSRLIKKTRQEIAQFIRNIQIKYIFMGESSKQEIFTGNKKWKPPNNKSHQAIVAMGDMLNEDITKLIKNNKMRHNISTKDKNALISLRQNTNIIIKKADKGGSIVVLDADDYVLKIDKMLSDATTYTELDLVNLDQAKTEVDNIIKDLLCKNYISKRQKQFLTNFTPKMPIFYGLPKIHKKENPLRPIVSQIDSPSYKLNKYLDYILTTAEKEIPYLLQDTSKFLQNIENLHQINQITHPKPILFTIDVTSLITLIYHTTCA